MTKQRQDQFNLRVTIQTRCRFDYVEIRIPAQYLQGSDFFLPFLYLQKYYRKPPRKRNFIKHTKSSLNYDQHLQWLFLPLNCK